MSQPLRVSVHGQTAQALKQRLLCILDCFDSNARCLYVDYPIATNIGDLLINRGAEQLFAERKVKIWKRFNYWDFPRTIKGITRKDVFLMHGGGNFGDLWFNFQAFRERVLEQYPENRIIFLPQTMHYASREKEQASIERLKRHKNLHVFARDFQSLERLKSYGLPSVSAMPDTAHWLAGSLLPTTDIKPRGTLRLLRQDLEFSEMPERLRHIPGDQRDWDDGIFGRRRMYTHKVVTNSVKAMGRYGPPIDCHSLWYWHRDKLIDDSVRVFSRYETVLTNRLHAMILGLLLGKKVVAFDNSYGKLSRYYQSWLSGSEEIQFHEPAVKHAQLA